MIAKAGRQHRRLSGESKTSNLFITLDYLPLKRGPGYVNHAIFNGTGL